MCPVTGAPPPSPKRPRGLLSCCYCVSLCSRNVRRTVGDELSSEDENARAAAKKDAIRRKQQKTKLANAHAARAAEHARSKEEADSGSRVTIRSYFSTLPASKAAKKEVTESPLANNSDETEDYMSDASECETQSGGCVGGGDQSSSIRAGLLGRKSRRHA